MNYVLCHYAEIGIKGRNRRLFEERLRENIQLGLERYAPGSFESVKIVPGAVLIKLTAQSAKSPEETIAQLKNTFGVANFSLAAKVPQELVKIKETALELLSKKKFKSFKIDARRSQKTFPLSSQKVNEEVGEFIVSKLKKKVNLGNPDLTLFVEIVQNSAFLYLEKIPGPGGLPVGIAARSLVMLSGGIDSPVAAYYALKRGSPVDFIHFHSLPYTSPSSVEKAQELVEILSKFQPQNSRSKPHLVPLYPIQKEILLKTPPRLRVVLYRRFMFKIAEEIAQKEGDLALVTGESLGQVASQTLENMAVIQEEIKMPILRPLVGFDKQEIVDASKEIGTYEISILPHDDCCSLFIPPNPATKAKLPEIEKAESALDKNKLIKEAVRQTKVQ